MKKKASVPEATAAGAVCTVGMHLHLQPYIYMYMCGCVCVCACIPLFLCVSVGYCLLTDESSAVRGLQEA